MQLLHNPFSKESKQQNTEAKIRKEELGMQQQAQLYDIASQPIQESELPIEGQAKADLTKWQQNLEEELFKMTLSLRNCYKDDEGKLVPKLDADGEKIPPLCSEACISELIAILQPVTSRNLMMSHLSEDFIRNKLIELSNAVTLLIAGNRRKFKIEMSSLTPIIKIFQGAAEPTFYRAFQGNEKKYLGSISRNIYTHQDKEGDDKKKNWIDKHM